ncbi:unnamed protein product [Dovyalis caffra]|uniref:Hydroxyproline-rich glycoprotein family protein n=1 Tax=Dovyalis caffra TaxID=77055 RepID=A0AAV1SVW8_9ROSI|nr:unnamed protein product [Dovyalis caffra]
MEAEEEMPLFWLQATDRPRRIRRQASSVCLNSGVFLIVLLVLAFTFVFVIVPSVGSFTSHVLRPHSIKKSWDSLNFFLVLFAIVCGFLSRNNSSSDNETKSYYEDQSLANVQKSQPSTPSRRWFEYQDRTVSYNTLNRLRSSSSYPDLRQESLERWRFYDDTHLNNYRFSTSNDQIHHDHHHPQQHPQDEETKKQEEEDVGVKDIDVDTFVTNQKEVSYRSSPPPSPPLPPSPPPSKLVRRKVKRTYQDLGYHEKRTDHDQEKKFENLYNIPPPSPLPPPPPPTPPPMFSKNDKRRGKDFLISLRRKKKKQRQKSVENLESLFNPEPSTTTSTLHLIPPPPPPPPPHFFQTLFSKKGKTKKLHPVPPPPPPPPPPVTRVSKVVSQKVTSRTKAQVAAVTSHKPPKTVKTSSFNSVEENNVASGNASPLIPIPPPPPPPPFKMPAWKFVLDGDYVRVESFDSSRSGSPDLDGIEDATSDKDQSSPMAAAGGSDSAAMPLFCPSPDVNTKADNFIARFRAGLNLEKVNSVRGRSNLGPEASTS